MQYEKEILQNLLIESGIAHRLDNRITPSKHPYMRSLQKNLKRLKIKYTYFPDTDSLSVVSIDDSVEDNLCHALMMPCDVGISVLVVIRDETNIKIILEDACATLDVVIPQEMGYTIVGIV